jgi:RimJ/RimL family protein N-acetyltransferase
LQYLPETDETEVGYLLGKTFWGKGIATSTALVSIAYGFKTMQLPRIVALVHPQNNASIRVIEKIGMKPVDRINLWDMDLMRYAVNKKEYAKHNRKKSIV